MKQQKQKYEFSMLGKEKVYIGKIMEVDGVKFVIKKINGVESDIVNLLILVKCEVIVIANNTI